MSEDSTPLSNNPRRHRPRLNELSKETTEQDLWDLDDEDSIEAAAAETPAAEAPVESTSPAVEAPEDQAEAEDPTEEIEEPLPQEGPAEPTPTPEEEEPSPAPTLVETYEEETSPTGPETPASPAVAPIASTKPSRKEWIGLGVLGVVSLALTIWWLVGLFSSVPTTRLGEDDPEFPIAGRFMKVQSAESFWRKPIREGENQDAARGEALQIPVALITLEGSGNGALRAIFRDDQGEFIGDSISRPFTAGHFDQSQSATVEFPATSGFIDDASFNAYRVGGERWTVEILEGPSEGASGSEFQSLFIAPISSLRR